MLNRKWHEKSNVKMIFQRWDLGILLFGSSHLLHQIALTTTCHLRLTFVLTEVFSNVLAVELERNPNPYTVQTLIQNH